jgi:hypothetical protein
LDVSGFVQGHLTLPAVIAIQRRATNTECVAFVGRGTIFGMPDQTLVVLASDHQEAAWPLVHVSAVIRWLRGDYSTAHLQVGARLTEQSTVFAINGESTLVESRLGHLSENRHPGPGSRLRFDDYTTLVVKRCAIVPQPPRSEQNRVPSTNSDFDDFDRMIEVLTKMAALSLQDF